MRVAVVALADRSWTPPPLPTQPWLANIPNQQHSPMGMGVHDVPPSPAAETTPHTNINPTTKTTNLSLTTTDSTSSHPVTIELASKGLGLPGSVPKPQELWDDLAHAISHGQMMKHHNGHLLGA